MDTISLLWLTRRRRRNYIGAQTQKNEIKKHGVKTLFLGAVFFQVYMPLPNTLGLPQPPQASLRRRVSRARNHHETTDTIGWRTGGQTDFWRPLHYHYMWIFCFACLLNSGRLLVKVFREKGNKGYSIE